MEYDLVVIGAGPGGYVAAIRASQLGLKTALVEKNKNLGGTCMNVGCIPSKALLHSSELYMEMREKGKALGLVFTDLSANLAAMQKRKEGIVERLNGGINTLVKHNKITVYHGRASLNNARTVVIEKDSGEVESLTAAKIILATGSEPVEIPALPFDGKQIISSTEALSLKSVPASLLIVGGGAIGLELGSVWARLGSAVTIIEAMPEILPGWDMQLAKIMHRELKKQGLNIITKTKIASCKIQKKQVHLLAEDSSVSIPEGDKVLVAVGRRPCFEGLNIEALGLRMEGSRLWVDEQYRSSEPSILAIGDIIHGPMLAHKAEEEAIVAVECLTGMKPSINYNLIPNVVYTAPEAASVGYSEEDLKEKRVDYTTSSAPFAANGRALSMDAPIGFVKILAEKQGDRVLGVHIVGAQASSLISEAVSVMEFGGSSEDIARMVHAHPTLTEVLKEAAMGIAGHAIHSVK